MVQRIVEDNFSKDRLLALIAGKTPPFTVSITEGGRRSISQNKLQRLWMKEISEQLGGTFETPEMARGYCKLVYGVPILREADEAFKAQYDKIVKPLPYADKLACMMVPIDLPVTSRMNTKQLTAYLDAVHREFSTQGVELTIPQDKSLDWRPSPPVEVYAEENA